MQDSHSSGLVLTSLADDRGSVSVPREMSPCSERLLLPPKLLQKPTPSLVSSLFALRLEGQASNASHCLAWLQSHILVNSKAHGRLGV